MLLGGLAIGSPVLLDLNRNGKNNCVSGVASIVSDIAVSLSKNGSIQADGKYIILEATDESNGHIYRFTKVNLYLRDNQLIAESNEDIDYHVVRQERRFRYRMPCHIHIGDKYIHGASLNDVSVSGLSLIVPDNSCVTVGEEMSITTYYTDHSKHELKVYVVRVDEPDSGSYIVGCRISEGKEFTKAVIEKLRSVHSVYTPCH